jgi:prevent-host-death family protein
MLRISSAELQRQFGLYSEKAQREPVTVTRHGRDSVVLMSIADYERLKSFDTREAYSVFDLPDDLAEAILAIDLPEDEDAVSSDATE